MTDKESDIYATGYWNGIAYKKPRELTDEEILELYHSKPRFDALDNFKYLNFAKEILKKASEK